MTGASPIERQVPVDDDFFAPGATFTVEARQADGAPAPSAATWSRHAFKALVPAKALARSLALACVTAASLGGAPSHAAPSQGSDVDHLKPMVERALAPWARLHPDAALEVTQKPVFMTMLGQPHAVFLQKGEGEERPICTVSLGGLRSVYETLFTQKEREAEAAVADGPLQRWSLFRQHVALHEAFHCEGMAGFMVEANGWQETAVWLKGWQKDSTAEGLSTDALAQEEMALVARNLGLHTDFPRHVSTLLQERYADARALLEVKRLGGHFDQALDVVIDMRARSAKGLKEAGMLNPHDTMPVLRHLAASRPAPSSPEEAASMAREMAVGSVVHELSSISQDVADAALSNLGFDDAQRRVASPKLASYLSAQAQSSLVSRASQASLATYVPQTGSQADAMQPAPTTAGTALSLLAQKWASDVAKRQSAAKPAAPSGLMELIGRLRGGAAARAEDREAVQIQRPRP